MSDECKCPACGGPANHRPEVLGGGVFCRECGVLDQDRLVEMAHRLLEKQMGMLPGRPPRISKEKIWAEFSKQAIDLA